MTRTEMSETSAQVENRNKLEIEGRIGLILGSDVQHITSRLATSLGVGTQSISYQGSDRNYVFAPLKKNDSGKLIRPHVAVIYPDNGMSYVRAKVPEGKKPQIENISRKTEHLLEFDANSSTDRDRAIEAGILLVGGSTEGLIFGPKFRKDKWLFQYENKDYPLEISGDKVVITGDQPIPTHNRFAGRTLNVIEYELLDPKEYDDKQIQNALFRGKRKIIDRLIDMGVTPTYVAPGKSSFSEQLLLESGELQAQSKR